MRLPAQALLAALALSTTATASPAPSLDEFRKHLAGGAAVARVRRQLSQRARLVNDEPQRYPRPTVLPSGQQQYQHFQAPYTPEVIEEVRYAQPNSDTGAVSNPPRLRAPVVSGGYSNTKLQGYGPQTGSPRPVGTRRPQPVYRPNPQQETEKEREEEEKRETDRASLVELMMEKAREAARKAAKEEERESEAKMEDSQGVSQRQTPVPRNPPEVTRSPPEAVTEKSSTGGSRVSLYEKLAAGLKATAEKSRQQVPFVARTPPSAETLQASSQSSASTGDRSQSASQSASEVPERRPVAAAQTATTAAPSTSRTGESRPWERGQEEPTTGADRRESSEEERPFEPSPLDVWSNPQQQGPGEYQEWNRPGQYDEGWTQQGPEQEYWEEGAQQEPWQTRRAPWGSPAEGPEAAPSGVRAPEVAPFTGPPRQTVRDGRPPRPRPGARPGSRPRPQSGVPRPGADRVRPGPRPAAPLQPRPELTAGVQLASRPPFPEGARPPLRQRRPPTTPKPAPGYLDTILNWFRGGSEEEEEEPRPAPPPRPHQGLAAPPQFPNQQAGGEAFRPPPSQPGVPADYLESRADNFEDTNPDRSGVGVDVEEWRVVEGTGGEPSGHKAPNILPQFRPNAHVEQMFPQQTLPPPQEDERLPAAGERRPTQGRPINRRPGNLRRPPRGQRPAQIERRPQVEGLEEQTFRRPSPGSLPQQRPIRTNPPRRPINGKPPRRLKPSTKPGRRPPTGTPQRRPRPGVEAPRIPPLNTNEVQRRRGQPSPAIPGAPVSTLQMLHPSLSKPSVLQPLRPGPPAGSVGGPPRRRFRPPRPSPHQLPPPLSPAQRQSQGPLSLLPGPPPPSTGVEEISTGPTARPATLLDDRRVMVVGPFGRPPPGAPLLARPPALAQEAEIPQGSAPGIEDERIYPEDTKEGGQGALTMEDKSRTSGEQIDRVGGQTSPKQDSEVVRLLQQTPSASTVAEIEAVSSGTPSTEDSMSEGALPLGAEDDDLLPLRETSTTPQDQPVAAMMMKPKEQTNKPQKTRPEAMKMSSEGATQAWPQPAPEPSPEPVLETSLEPESSPEPEPAPEPEPSPAPERKSQTAPASLPPSNTKQPESEPKPTSPAEQPMKSNTATTPSLPTADPRPAVGEDGTRFVYATDADSPVLTQTFERRQGGAVEDSATEVEVVGPEMELEDDIEQEPEPEPEPSPEHEQKTDKNEMKQKNEMKKEQMAEETPMPEQQKQDAAQDKISHSKTPNQASTKEEESTTPSQANQDAEGEKEQYSAPSAPPEEEYSPDYNGEYTGQYDQSYGQRQTYQQQTGEENTEPYVQVYGEENAEPYQDQFYDYEQGYGPYGDEYGPYYEDPAQDRYWDQESYQESYPENYQEQYQDPQYQEQNKDQSQGEFQQQYPDTQYQQQNQGEYQTSYQDQNQQPNQEEYQAQFQGQQEIRQKAPAARRVAQAPLRTATTQQPWRVIDSSNNPSQTTKTHVEVPAGTPTTMVHSVPTHQQTTRGQPITSSSSAPSTTAAAGYPSSHVTTTEAPYELVTASHAFDDSRDVMTLEVTHKSSFAVGGSGDVAGGSPRPAAPGVGSVASVSLEDLGPDIRFDGPEVQYYRPPEARREEAEKESESGRPPLEFTLPDLYKDFRPLLD
ncbi:titin-like [Amphibalanus amphitrite]|uniref:titin-like n=1 Tax=Amphibalanus amphitrite TaxID=1232801 RepID=UPI001C90B970|nr:titin-like [Amphibalanus amphitrite]